VTLTRRGGDRGRRRGPGKQGPRDRGARGPVQRVSILTDAAVAGRCRDR